ncbi:MAG: thioredoxin family protein [Flavobacteriaceae bacterium]
MKKILFLAVIAVFTTVTSVAQTINWVTLEEAVALQKENPKKIMMDVYTNWCGPCKMLDKNTFHNADVVKYVNDNFYAVKFNAEGNENINYKGKAYTNPGYKEELANKRNSVHELSRHFQVRAYPTIVFMDEEANLLAPITGYQQPTQLELYLKLFKENHHKDITTQEEFNTYHSNFKPEFKG